MTERFSPYVFMAVYCSAYVIALAFDLPLFRYYPLHGELCWGIKSLSDAGPQMVWYGLMASAAIPATISALSSPPQVSNVVSRLSVWVFPVVAMFSTAALLRGLFY